MRTLGIKDDRSSKVRVALNEYLKPLHITIADILGNTDAYVFGGAVRDSLAGVPIKDIDICGLPKSISDIMNVLDRCMVRLPLNTELHKMYEDITIINEPITYIGKYNTDIQIQLIRPTGFYNVHTIHGEESSSASLNTDLTFNFLAEFVSNVDIDICGVMYNWRYGVTECIPGVIKNIRDKVFNVLPKNKMYSKERLQNRIQKMEQKGYIRYKGDIIPIERRYNPYKK